MKWKLLILSSLQVSWYYMENSASSSSSQSSHAIAAEAPVAAAGRVEEAGRLFIAVMVVVVTVGAVEGNQAAAAAAAAAVAELPAKAHTPAMLTVPEKRTYHCQCTVVTTKVRSLMSVEDVISIPNITFLVLPVRGLGM